MPDQETCPSWRAYKELLLWFAGRKVARFAAEKPQGAMESLDADLQTTAFRVASKGKLAASRFQPRSTRFSAKPHAGSYATWQRFHEVTRGSDFYPWTRLNTLGPCTYLYRDRPDRMSRDERSRREGLGPSREGLMAALAIRETSAFVEASGFESRQRTGITDSVMPRSDQRRLLAVGGFRRQLLREKTREVMEALRQGCEG